MENTEPQRRCKRCRFEYIGDAEITIGFTQFVRADRGDKRAYHRLVCNLCFLERRTGTKSTAPWLTKARDSVRRHAKRYGLSPKDFARRFGWHIARIAHDLEHAFSNTCTYCWTPYAEMENGRAGITLDVVDPTQPPYYATNVRPCCSTCNPEKQRTPPHLWATKCDLWRRRRQFLATTPVPIEEQFQLWPKGN